MEVSRVLILTKEKQCSFTRIITILVIDESPGLFQGKGICSIECHLPTQCDSPEYNLDHYQRGQTKIASGATRKPLIVEYDKPDEQSTNNCPCAFERSIESTSGAIKHACIDGSLVRVKIVVCEKHRKKGYIVVNINERDARMRKNEEKEYLVCANP